MLIVNITIIIIIIISSSSTIITIICIIMVIVITISCMFWVFGWCGGPFLSKLECCASDT